MARARSSCRPDTWCYIPAPVFTSESVTRGARVSSFFWMQSLVREDSQRALLLDMDVAIQRLNQDAAGHPSIVQLTGIYHNLLRRWVDV